MEFERISSRLIFIRFVDVAGGRDNFNRNIRDDAYVAFGPYRWNGRREIKP
jgi:hypothetical protein